MEAKELARQLRARLDAAGFVDRLFVQRASDAAVIEAYLQRVEWGEVPMPRVNLPAAIAAATDADDFLRIANAAALVTAWLVGRRVPRSPGTLPTAYYEEATR